MTSARAFMEEAARAADTRDTGIVNAVIQFELAGEGARIFHYRIRNGVLKVYPGLHARPNVVIGTTLETWSAIVTGKLRPIRAYLAGEVKVKGDIVLAQRAVKLFSKA